MYTIVDDSFPLTWPLYVLLIVISIAGLKVGWRPRKEQRPGELIGLQEVLRWPEGLTLLYGLIGIIRTIWTWCGPFGGLRTPLFADPPTDVILRAYGNGLILAWVSVYVLFIYIRSRRQ